MNEYSEYIIDVQRDFGELKKYYPYSYLTFPISSEPVEASIIVIAANNGIIQKLCGTKKDFLGEWSKELYIQIPFDYKMRGCDVYGGKWIDVTKLSDEDIHFYSEKNNYGYKLCVGVPESFRYFPNVILENVITAEMLLIAYMKYLSGKSDRLELRAYSHGNKGREQYMHDKKSKRRRNM